ncbi:MAG: general secretion pathway protein GspK [Gammaproteobacteria bacterium]|nr:general secretion pathway protein GspK [Gammaproteobacteria bacterium]
MCKPTAKINRRKIRGIVLPTVLWITILTITVAVSYASAVHVNTRSTSNLKISMTLKYDAISGIYLALDRAMSNPVDKNTAYQLEFNESTIDIEISPEAGKTNINTADESELRASFIDAGFDLESARLLSARVIDWRDADSDPQAHGGMEDADYHAGNKAYGARDSRIEDLSELLLVANIGRDDFVRLSRHFTIYGGAANRVYSITATSSRSGKDNLFTTKATVQVTGQSSRPYRILKWQHNNG